MEKIVNRKYRSQSLLGLLDFLFALIEILIGLRLLLKLLGASTSSSFVNWIYETSAPLINPFIGMFPAPRIEGAYVLEISAIFALAFYALINYLLNWIISEITYRNDRRA